MFTRGANEIKPKCSVQRKTIFKFSMQLSKPELTAFRRKDKNHFFEVFWAFELTSVISIPERLGGGCGPSETAAGRLKVRRGRLDLAGQLRTSSHGPSSHCPAAPFTQRAHPTPPTAPANPNPNCQASRTGLGLHQAEDYEQRGGRGQPPRPPRGSRSPRRDLHRSGGRDPDVRVFPDGGQLLPGAGRRECTASRIPLVHCSLSCAPRNKGAGGRGGSRRVLRAPGAPALRASRRPHPAFTCTSLSSTRKYSSRCR